MNSSSNTEEIDLPVAMRYSARPPPRNPPSRMAAPAPIDAQQGYSQQQSAGLLASDSPAAESPSGSPRSAPIPAAGGSLREWRRRSPPPPAARCAAPRATPRRSRSAAWARQAPPPAARLQVGANRRLLRLGHLRRRVVDNRQGRLAGGRRIVGRRRFRALLKARQRRRRRRRQPPRNPPAPPRSASSARSAATAASWQGSAGSLRDFRSEPATASQSRASLPPVIGPICE